MLGHYGFKIYLCNSRTKMKEQKEGQYASKNLFHFTKNNKRPRNGSFENDEGFDFQISPNCGRRMISSTQACDESCEAAYTILAISVASINLFLSSPLAAQESV